MESPWKSCLFWKKHVYGVDLKKKLIEPCESCGEFMWSLGNSPTHLHQFSLVHGPVFWMTTLGKIPSPYPFSITLASWLNCSRLSQFEALQISMFNVESDVSYIATSTTICLLVKNWLVLHLNFTSVFCVKSYLEPNPEGGGRVEIASECLAKGQGGGKNPLVGRWSWSPWAMTARFVGKVGQIQCFGKFWRKGGGGVIVGIMIELC